MRRSELREHIFKVIFDVSFNEREDMKEHMDLYFEQLENASSEDLKYIQEKSEKIIEKIPEIDELLNEKTKGWKTTRMNKVDLCILRLAVYEMKWDDDVPVGVAIDEAVELAKSYSGEGAPSFVNGVLAKMIQ